MKRTTRLLGSTVRRQTPRRPSIRYSATVCAGVLLALLAGIYLFSSITQTDAAESGARDGGLKDNLVNGRLAYSIGIYGPGPNRTLAIANPDGSDVFSVSVTPGLHPNKPAWSPDGTRLVFHSDQNPYDIFVIRANGTEQTNLTSTEWPMHEADPSWSVTGKIAYERYEEFWNTQIWTMNADGGGKAHFSSISRPSPTDPEWSPDGLRLAFASGGDIWLINADGTGERRVTNDPSTDSEPHWSPDGSKIVFARESAGSRIFVVNPDGGNEMELSGGTSDKTPAWSPDGSKIAYRRSNGMWTMNADGSDQVRILQDIVAFPNCCDRLPESPAWQPIAQMRSSASFDFDGDERSDISVYRPSEGMWYLLGSTSGFSGMQWGISTDKIVPADYDGDMKTDGAVWREADRTFYILNSFDNTARFESFGTAGDLPVAGDWDGDGKADLSIYRSGAQSSFHYRRSMGNPLGQVTIVDWGVVGDKPVLGDFDGDGKTDAAVFRPADGIWYIDQSSNGQDISHPFGNADDVLVPADFDGDGKTDVAVYREGIWYIRRSAQGVMALQFGLPSDVTVPADYDGDGRSDIAVYREGIWWILKSNTGWVLGLQFGLKTDQPIPAAFVR